ncbi:MAG: TPR end-of-group domain-containing protein [Planctomycetota bacterium]|jgi:Flp pilus assembly protein TadD
MSRSIGNGVAAVWLTLMGIGPTGGLALAEPVTSAPQEASQEDAPTEEQARSLLGDGRWEEAAEAWGQIAQREPDNGTAWFYLGYCLHAAGRLEEAIEAHQKAATFDDYHGIAQYNLGCAYALAGRPDAAFEALAGAQAAGWRLRDYAFTDSDLESLREDPRLAELLAREPVGWRGRIQQVLARARQYADQHAPQAKQQLSGIMQQVMRHAHAMLAQLQEKLAEDERFAPIAQKLQGWLGGQADASAHHDPAGDTEPSGPLGAAALVEKAQQHQQAGEWAEAAAAYGALIEHQPDNAGLWFALAYSLHMAGDYEKAIEAHRKSATFDQTRGISLYNLACAYALTGQPDEALKALKESREAGFDITSARSDSDLGSLRDDPRFKELLADVEGDRRR